MHIKCEGKIPLWITSRKCEDNIKMGITEIASDAVGWLRPGSNVRLLRSEELLVHLRH
jgi:hypothetical protein